MGAFAAAVLVTLLGVSTPSRAQTGTVRIKIVKIGFIVGVGGGSGTLNYHGHIYRFGVGGVSAGTIGIAGATLVGTAYNLRSPADGPNHPGVCTRFNITRHRRA